MGEKKLKVWPETVTHQGRVYGRTGKTGRNTRAGIASAEYEDAATARRVWLLEDGRVEGEGDQAPEGYRFVTIHARLVVRGSEPATLADAARIVAGDSEEGAGTYEMSSVPVDAKTAMELADEYGDADVFLAECDSCDRWHPKGFSGDCRDPATRFMAPTS